MSTLPTTPASPLAAPRPMHGAAPAPSAAGANIDPLKLLNRHKWKLVAAAAAGALLGTGANYALESFYPLWKPIAVFRVNPPIETVGQTGMMNPEEMNRFMQTQIRFMTSDTVLGRVADDPTLLQNAKHWCARFMKKDPNGGSEPVFNSGRALRTLSDDVSARVYPNTSLIELSFSYRYKEDATAIVGLVREKYTGELEAQGRTEQDENTKSLRDAIDRIDKEIAALQTRRKSIIEKEKLDSIDEKVGAAQMHLQRLNDEVMKVTQDLTAAQSQRDSMSNEFSNTQEYVANDEIVQESERDPAVADMRTLISRYETNLAAMKEKGQKDEHREVKALVAQLAGAKQNLNEILVKVQQKLFNSRLENLGKAVKQLESQLVRLEAEQQEARTKMVSLNQLASEISDINRQIENLQKTKAENNAKLEGIKAVSQLGSKNRVMLFQRELVPSELSFPQLKFMIPLGIILTVGLVGGFVVLREIADQRVKGPGDINLIPRMRLLGWVPDAAEDPEGKGAPETAFRDRPKGIVAESFRQLRSAIAKRIEASGHKTILVVSGMPMAGATSVTANLALALAAADKKVLIIDANLRRPTLHRVFGVQESPGLADVLMAARPFDAAVQRTSSPNVDLLTAGSKELRVVERLAAEAKGDVLTKAKAIYDVILIDVAPAVVAGDAIALAHRVDATLLVVRAMSDKRGMIARIGNELGAARSDFLGIVVNGVRASSGGYLKGNIRTASEYAKA